MSTSGLETRVRQLRSFAGLRRALRAAETVESVAEETIAFARRELGATHVIVYAAERDEADFTVVGSSHEDRAGWPEVLDRVSPLAQRLSEEPIVEHDEVLSSLGDHAVALALRESAERMVGFAIIAGTDGALDPEVLTELAFDAEGALSARVMSRLRAEELAVLEIQERELVGLLREVQERDAIIQKDLEEARDFQRKMLGQPPRVNGAGIEIIYRPLGLVGGDLYAVSVHGDRLRLFIADATGHGVSASLTTMFIKSGYEAATVVAADPAALLEMVNEGIAKTYKAAQMLFSAACVDLDLVTGAVAFASAAHPPLCLVRGDSAELVEGGGAFLGLRTRVRFETRRTTIEPGDGIYLFTDGLSEIANASGEQFGEERLRSVIQLAHIDGMLAGKALDDAVNAFAGKTELTDDATFIGVRYGARDDDEEPPQTDRLSDPGLGS